MAVCAICLLHVTDLEGHLKSQHSLKYNQVLQLAAKIKDERKLKVVKRLLMGKWLKGKKEVLPKPEDREQERVLKPRDNVNSCDECGVQYHSRKEKYMHPYFHMGADVNRKAWEHSHHILQPFLLTTHEHGEYACQSFNVPLLPNVALSEEYIRKDLKKILEVIGGRQFKVKVGVSRILRHNPSGRLQFFTCEHDGECVVAKTGTRSAVYNHKISSYEDIKTLAAELANTDMEGALERDRADTSYSLVCPTNIRYYVFKLDYLVGARPYQLPRWVVQKQCLIDLRTRQDRFYNNLCLFRCIAYHSLHEDERDATEKLTEINNKSLFMCQKYMDDKDGEWDYQAPLQQQAIVDRGALVQFPGIHMREMANVERFFQLDIYIYQATEDGKKMKIIYMPAGEGEHTGHKPLHLLFLTPNELIGEQLGTGHFVYINSFKTLCKCYVCSGCNRNFTDYKRCWHHMKYTCNKKNNGRKDVFPGRISTTNCSLIEKLFRVGVTVDEDLLYYKDYITFDFESLLEPQPEVEDDEGRKTTVLSKHIPVSVGLCTSHDDIDPMYVCDGNPQSLIKQFLMCLLLLRRRMVKRLFEKYKNVFAELVDMIQVERMMLLYEQNDCHIDNVPEQFREEIEIQLTWVDEDKTSPDFVKPREKWIENLIQIKKQLENYIRAVVCLGFNSAKYDIKIIAPYMIPLMLGESPEFLERCVPCLYSPSADWHGEQHPLGDYSHLDPETIPEAGDIEVIKQHGGYTAFYWGKLLEFKDVYRFCSPNTNLASFMKMHGAEEAKGHFPYQWLTSYNKLDQDHLPPIEDFATGLVAGENVLGRTDQEIGNNYAHLLDVWHEHGMESMHDFLRWYNMLDVTPFAQAIKNWIAPYHKTELHPSMEGVHIRDRLDGVDILKTCVSAPGVAQSLMNHHVAAEPGYQGLYLFHDNEQDLVHLFRNNITGGPSIVFNRQVTEQDQGHVLGYDANALYGGVMLTDMPTGPAIRYKPKPGEQDDPEFIRSIAYSYESRLAMQYLTDPDNELEDYKHAFNCGHEVFVGPYRVDAISDRLKSVIEVHGCWAHAHDCHPRFREGPEQEKKRERHEKRMAFLRSVLEPNYVIYEYWTCNRMFWKYRNNMKLVGSPCSDYWKLGDKHPVKQSDILTAVQEDKLFGFMEVDINVPPHLHEYFSDFPPLFATVDVPYEVIGEYMQQKITELGKSKKDRIQLVSGLAAEKILLGTPAIQWYLDHGLVITKVHQIIEFRGRPILNRLVSKLTNTRRQATAQGDTATANRKKLEGNSLFGKTLTDKDKHSRVSYVKGNEKVMFYHNKPRFKTSRVIDGEGEFYEVELHKTMLKHDTPIQLGKMILDVAKIRMCQWVYDFLGYYLKKGSYKLIQMDTDSMYAHFNLELDYDRMDDPTYCPLRSLVREDRLAEFDEHLYGNCRDDWQPDYSSDFLCRCCCAQHNKFDQKTPLLFKLEAYGKNMTELCSKTYAMVQSDGTEKVASKGVQKKALLHLLGDAVNESMSRCLHEGEDTMVENTSFRLHKGEIHTMKQKKSAFNQIYTKREVLADGISTRPLDLVLRPHQKYERGLVLTPEDPDDPLAQQPAPFIDGEAEIDEREDEARVRVELGFGDLADYGVAEEAEPRGIDL